MTFMAELWKEENADGMGAPWSVERRFRITEVFLAILWVGHFLDVVYWHYV